MLRSRTLEGQVRDHAAGEGAWQRWLRGSDWPDLLGLVSPKLFDVLPPWPLARQAAELGKNYFDSSAFAETRRRISGRIARSGLGITLREPRTVPTSRGLDRPRAVLGLYFFQLFAGEEALLDLRRRTFAPEGDVLAWDPRPLFVRWQPAFLKQLRALYSGFYDGDEDRYQTALTELGIAPAESLFREHFGGSQVEAARFRVEDFRQTFHRVFLLCHEAHVTLHPNFVPLGVYLAGLYRHLEQMGGAYDVRAAFLEARASAASLS